MVLVSYISRELLGFSHERCEEIKSCMIKTFGKVEIKEEDYTPVMELLKHDKKNEHGNINFVLLESIGKPRLNCLVENDLIFRAFKYYNS